MKLRNLITEKEDDKEDVEFSLEGLMELFNLGGYKLSKFKIDTEKGVLREVKNNITYSVSLSKKDLSGIKKFTVIISGVPQYNSIMDKFTFDLKGAVKFEEFMVSIEEYTQALNIVSEFDNKINKIFNSR
jgi:hypothetical protein